MISITERRKIILESMRHEGLIKDAQKAIRLHAEKRARDLAADIKEREARTRSLIAHEENNRANREARRADVQARQDFIKQSLRIL